MNIFTEITSADSIYILLWLAGAFLIGIGTGWSVWGLAKQKLEQDIKEWLTDYENLQKEFAALTTNFEEVNARIDKVKENRAVLLQDFEAYKGEMNTLFAENQKLKVKLKEANEVIASNEDAMFESDILNLKIKGLETELDEAEQRRNSLSEEIELLKAELKKETANDNADDKKLKIANTRISVLEGKVAGLNHQLTNTELALENASAAIAASFKDDTTAAEQENPNSMDNIPVASIFDKIGTATLAEKDDLTQIDGIGTFLENKLNELGIYTYEQIANFDDSIISIVTNEIAFFPGRIERDQWIKQALSLMGSRSFES